MRVPYKKLTKKLQLIDNKHTQHTQHTHLNSDSPLLVRCSTQVCRMPSLGNPGQIVDKRFKDIVQRQVTVVVNVYVHHSLCVWTEQETRGN